jgi:hypothetical protein
VDLDDLFGEGTELGNDVIVKAQLRFRIHPPKHPVAQDIVDRLVSGYDERLEMICKEIDDVLQHADPRRNREQPLVLSLGVGRDDVYKARGLVYAPGARGGKWYRDKQGRIRYGDPPQTQAKQPDQAGVGTAPVENAWHYKPAPFIGGSDRDVTDYLLNQGHQHGFSKPQLKFLGTWYGTDTESGALYAAFLACTGLTREDLKQDLTQFRFGSQQMTYEDAVFAFFGAQAALFMGKDPETPEEQKAWDNTLNNEIKPALDDVFSKYEKLKGDPKFQEHFAHAPNRQRARFFANARRHEDDTRDIADDILSDPNPSKQVAKVIAGLKAMCLFVTAAKVARIADVQGMPHLNDSMVLDEHLLMDDPDKNPLLEARDRFGTLSASQLLLVYLAAELHRRWDHHTLSYSHEEHADVSSSTLGQAALDALASKSAKWNETLPLIQKNLAKTVDRLVSALNGAGGAKKPKPKPKQKKRTKRK